MAQFDLKNATIRLKDGFSKTGAVDNIKAGTTGAAASIGATTFPVTGVTGIVATGTKFTVVGDPNPHRVTAHTETLSNTTSITFTPALTAAVSSGAAVTFSGYGVGATQMTVEGFVGIVEVGETFTIPGYSETYEVTAHSETLGDTTSLTFTPGLLAGVDDAGVITVGPHQIEVKIGEGNLTYSEKRTMEYTLDRGKLDTVREGDEIPVDVRMDFTWENLRGSDDDPPTIEDVLKKRGKASTWTSASVDPCEPHSINIEVEYIPPCSDDEKEIITLSDYRWEELNHDANAGTVSTSGKCNIKEASAVRVAQVPAA